MKRLALLTIPLFAAVLTAGGITARAAGGITARAAGGGTIYPEDDEFTKTLSFSSLTDYSVEDGLYAFADANNVIVYSDGNRIPYAANEVTAVDVKDGKIYYGCADGKAYTIPEQTELEYSFPKKQSEVLFNGYYYFTDESGLNVFNKSTKENTVYEGEYTNLKIYGEKVYASYGSVLYSFTGSERSEIVLEYAIDKADLKITVGQAAASLKKYAPVQFVTVDEGAFMTEIDLEKLDGEYFVPLNISKAEVETTALLLCYSGNAAIISIGDKGYAVLKTKVNETVIDCTTEKPFENAQMIGGNIYASPFVVSGTVSSSNAVGNTVKVLNRLENESILGSVFYEVEYVSGEESLKGYVAEGFLSKVIFGENEKPSEITDPQYSDSSDTKTILIIFAVVLLVLAAIAYVCHISGKGKRKKKKKEKEAEE